MKANQTNPAAGLFLVRPTMGRPAYAWPAMAAKSLPLRPGVFPAHHAKLGRRPSVTSPAIEKPTAEAKNSRQTRAKKSGSRSKGTPAGEGKGKRGRKATERKVRESGIGVVAGPRPGSKTAKVLSLLRREDGATLKELMKATGWQAHSVRGFLSGAVTKKMKLKLKSIKPEAGERSYFIRP